MRSDERDKIDRTLAMIANDAEVDAAKPIPFTALGVGTTHGETMAMIHALASIGRQLIKAVAIDDEGIA